MFKIIFHFLNLKINLTKLNKIINGMDDVEKFIKCPGILKKSITKSIIDMPQLMSTTNRVHSKRQEHNLNCFTKSETFKIDKRFYAFFINTDIVLIKWDKDKTVSMVQKERSILVELWKSGKIVKGQKWNKEREVGLLAACINFYEVEDYLILESNNDPDLKEFIF